MQVVFIIIIILSQVPLAEKTLSAFTLNVLHVVVCLCYFKRSEQRDCRIAGNLENHQSYNRWWISASFGFAPQKEIKASVFDVYFVLFL